jgi:hypothetical protein
MINKYSCLARDDVLKIDEVAGQAAKPEQKDQPQYFEKAMQYEQPEVDEKLWKPSKPQTTLEMLVERGLAHGYKPVSQLSDVFRPIPDGNVVFLSNAQLLQHYPFLLLDKVRPASPPIASRRASICRA